MVPGPRQRHSNERFRYSRYEPGQNFAPHTYDYSPRCAGEGSHFSFMIYLNEGFEGGEMAFHRTAPSTKITPERGKALGFYHGILHEARLRRPVMHDQRASDG